MRLHDLIRLRAEERGGQLAVVELADTDEVETRLALSYGQLDLEVDRVAAGAIALGLPIGGRVLVALSNRAEFVSTLFGLMRAGLVPALANPRLGAEDYARIIEELSPKALIGDDLSMAALRAANGAGLPLISLARETQVDGVTTWGAFLRDPVADRSREAASDIALILLTSGSTGRPKAVDMTHQGCVQHFEDQRPFYGAIYQRTPVTLAATPLFHKNGTGTIKTMLTMGGTIVIAPRFHPRRFLAAVQRHGVTTFTAVATMAMMLLDQKDLIEAGDWSKLDAIMIGAAPTGRVLLDAMEEAFGARVFHMYGTTEAGASLGHDPARRYTLDSCGRPLPGVTVRLVGPDGEEAAHEGELWVRSPAVALGYVGRPEETAARFSDGWYRTGDILERDAEGFFFFRGRVDDMFVCGGENIYPLEVERVLLKHPGIRSACVVAVPHRLKGQVPVAMIEAEPSLDEAAVKQWAIANGPAYAHPRQVWVEEALPIAPTGKIDRRAVHAMALARMEESA
ncbi:MAG: class I adenylate-forming enzyme family protein [Sphingobium sp.]|uniref:class I adenylate-forming enzyme family protein n=1 Tax=Sphingobium sp. TaxID=1912891 RepID=UPI003BAEDD9A